MRNDKDILSPKEIEDLVKGSDDMNMGEKTVYPYDFRSPSLLSKGKLRIFQLLMEEFVSQIQSFVAAQLKIPLEVQIGDIRQSAYSQFQERNEETFMVVFNMPPLEGTSILEIKLPFIIFINQVLLGKALEKFPEPRAITPVEEETATFLAERFLYTLQESFSKLIKFNFNIISKERNPQLLFLASPDEPTVIVSVQFKLGEEVSQIDFCFPYIVFNSLLPYLDVKKWFSITQRKKDERIDKLIKDNIENIKVDLVCELGSLDLALREILHLEKGDYLCLNVDNDALLNLKIGNFKKFKVFPGISHKKVALRIEKIIDEGR
ncbi:MAG: FliM/FliN family flagellar motor switch protein [Candidatus Omnitrophica bacterium]|nr:FliM/FliN family flagellar motor switch protein [Candidatus Omnitrophota bacterium]